MSQVTTDYRSWVSAQLAQQGAQVLVLAWDNASWHGSKEVQAWMCEQNRAAHAAQQQGQQVVRSMAYWLPVKSPRLNAIEPQWVHGKQAIVEPPRQLTAAEVRERVRSHFGCTATEPLKQNRQV